MIFTSFAPNIQIDDFWLAVKLSMPWHWPALRTGKAQKQLAITIGNHFNQECFLFDSGRNALHQLLQAYNLPSGSEIIIQGFTCSVVPHAIIRTNLVPVYVDINDQYNINPTDLNAVITPQTKAIIVQHTFGIPADLNAISKIAKEHNLILIEDLAHSLGAKHNNQEVGTFGDSAILSFGSDKVISASRGGALITNNKTVINTLNNQKFATSPFKLVLQNLLQPIFFFLAKPIYSFANLGKIILYTGRKLKLLPTILTNREKKAQGEVPTYTLANVLARQLLHQWQKLPKFIEHRQKIAILYEQTFHQNFPTGTSYLRYPIQTPNPKDLFKKTKQTGIILGDWYTQAIGPKDADPIQCGYHTNTCPKAEKLSQHIINLPTHIGITAIQAEEIIRIVGN
ncbi:hypothetical protein COV81_04505 [Candidatus Peregrinibacteria bacterium CG11_big_fil_rev_8_21_14_0_20_41_10]|nr:MAG: hypothetical protein COV81_04505 [Candidatus Peregrinibacteria bacterium CG11_big_fil_rev_8_21_14_0_20_41_10]PJC38373.1 MAG: hypothetical protein CO045_00620 [Candidatus Peregrinibacteria bacterium CG_4_9_14_0_2_um_filter_41_14]